MLSFKIMKTLADFEGDDKMSFESENEEDEIELDFSELKKGSTTK